MIRLPWFLVPGGPPHPGTADTNAASAQKSSAADAPNSVTDSGNAPGTPVLSLPPGCDETTWKSWIAVFQEGDRPASWLADAKQVSRVTRQVENRAEWVLWPASLCLFFALFMAPLLYQAYTAFTVALVGGLVALAALVVSFSLPMLVQWLVVSGSEREGWPRPSRYFGAVFVSGVILTALLVAGDLLLKGASQSDGPLYTPGDVRRAITWAAAENLPHVSDHLFIGACLWAGAAVMIIFFVVWLVATLVALTATRHRQRNDPRLGVSALLVETLHLLEPSAQTTAGSTTADSVQSCLLRHRSLAIARLNRAASNLEHWTRIEFEMPDTYRQEAANRTGFAAAEKIRSWSLQLAQMPREQDLKEVTEGIRHFLRALSQGIVGMPDVPSSGTGVRRPTHRFGWWSTMRSVAGSLLPLGLIVAVHKMLEHPEFPAAMWMAATVWAALGLVVTVDTSFDEKVRWAGVLTGIYRRAWPAKGESKQSTA